jgi:hypothetical protein
MERDYDKTNGACFGFYDESCKGFCKYWESCHYVTTQPNPDNAKRVRNAVSFEKNSFRVGSKDNTYPYNPGQDENYKNLSEVLNYILSLDDNTLSLLSELVRNPNISQAEMARARGVSRQRINTALLFAVRKHPELKSIFCLTLSKITAARNRYIRKDQDNMMQEELFE